MKKFLLFAALGMLISNLTACNTMEGLGQDVQNGGEKLEDAADRNK